jgi:hypothetical protein
LFSCNNKIPHAKNFIPNTIIAQIIVTARTPLVAFSISNLLNNRKIKTLGNTHNVTEWVIISDSASLVRYEWRDILPEEKKNMTIPIKKGKTTPHTIPVSSLSYFSENFIF